MASQILFLIALFLYTFAIRATPLPAVEEASVLELIRRENDDSVRRSASANNASILSIVLTGFEECAENSYQYETAVNWKDWVIDGFKEHYTMSLGEYRHPIPGDAQWAYPEVDWNSAAAIEFFGPGYKNKPFRMQIQENLNKHANMDYAWILGWRLVSSMNCFGLSNTADQLGSM